MLEEYEVCFCENRKVTEHINLLYLFICKKSSNMHINHQYWVYVILDNDPYLDSWYPHNYFTVASVSLPGFYSNIKRTYYFESLIKMDKK